VITIGAARERRLERGGAAGHQRHVRRVQREARVAEEDGDRQLVRLERVEARLEIVAGLARGERNEEAKVRPLLVQDAGRLDHEVGVGNQLLHAAAGQHRDRGAPPWPGEAASAPRPRSGR
jgi:hypothetical protein